MIGTPKTIKIMVSRKLGDNEFGSYGVEAELEVSLNPDDNRDEAFDENDAWLTAKVGMSMAEKKARIQKAQAEKPVGVEPNTGEVVYEKPKPAPVSETRVPVEDEKEYRVIDVDHFEITVGADNIRTCKVFGGPYKKFGVRCWPEPLEAVGIKLDTLEAGKFSLPEGYTKAKVLMVDDKPKKVWAFTK